jgi:hypothetical protein
VRGAVEHGVDGIERPGLVENDPITEQALAIAAMRRNASARPSASFATMRGSPCNFFAIFIGGHSV